MAMASAATSVLICSAALPPAFCAAPKRPTPLPLDPRLTPHRLTSSSSSCSRRLSSYSASTSSLPSTWIGSARCRAVGEGSQPAALDDQVVYQGVYGPWIVEPSDVREVILYRSGLVTAAVSFVIASSAALIPEGNIVGDVIKQDIDILYVIGAGGLGLSLLLIHIYVTPIKRFLQSLWVLGVLGSVGSYLSLAKPLNLSLIQYVVNNPVGVWFIGPLFAALTGLVFKEGLCYGKLEAGILTFIIPGILLGHLSKHELVDEPTNNGQFTRNMGCVTQYILVTLCRFMKYVGTKLTGLLDDGAKLSLLSIWMALFVVFAGRKFQQPIKDDIGDKSIFMFNALPEEEKKALLEKLEQQLE